MLDTIVAIRYIAASVSGRVWSWLSTRVKFDIVERVEHSKTAHCEVYDINVERTHNFVAGGVVTHNSIYRWRGARVENLHAIHAAIIRQAVLYKLEQNYRSTGNILKAANALISNNAGRLGKNLVDQRRRGRPSQAVRRVQ